MLFDSFTSKHLHGLLLGLAEVLKDHRLINRCGGKPPLMYIFASSMVYLWDIYDISMIYLWYIYGTSIVYIR